MRDPKKDIMLAPGNAALILIDYQPPQVSTVESMSRRGLINNVVALSKTAKLQGLPISLSTVNVSNGVNEDTIPELRAVLNPRFRRTPPGREKGKQPAVLAGGATRRPIC